MRLLVVNPNTTASMTRDIATAARLYAHPGTEIEAISPAWGPASIESHVEEELAAVATLETIAARADDVDGIAIACYGDPGLYAARELVDVPVVGIAEASMLLAVTVAHRFSIVSALERSRPLIEDVVRRYGLQDRCASVRTTPLAVLEIERDAEAAEREIVAAARRAVAEDGAEAICLGCAGMGPLDKRVQESVGVPVVDGVAAAVKLLEGIVGYGLTTSRAAAFRTPSGKLLRGESTAVSALGRRLGERGDD